MSACRRHYPGRFDGTDSLMTAPSTSAFPRLQIGRLLHYQFRGLLSVHSRYNLQTRRVALCDPLHRRLRRLCYLHRRSDCYRVERSSSRAGLSSRCGPAPFTAHCYRLITLRMPRSNGTRGARVPAGEDRCWISPRQPALENWRSGCRKNQGIVTFATTPAWSDGCGISFPTW
jgi:hypothetical protein